MAFPVLTSLDLNRNELLNARIQNLGTDPTGLTVNEKGLLWIVGTSIRYWDGTQIVTLGTTAGVDADTLDGQDGTYYLDLSNHTGTITSAAISNFSEAVDDRVATFIIGGTRINSTYDDVANTLTIDVDDSGLEVTSAKGSAGGYASLDGTGKVPSNQLPAIALTDVAVVADIAARDALTVQEGDVAVVTSTSQSFIYDGAAWQEITSPTDGVQSVSAALPITSTGGTTPEIGINAATTTSAGSMSAADKTKLDGIESNAKDDQNASEVPITDAGDYFTGTSVEAALQELGANAGTVTKHSENIGDGSATQFTVTHNMGTRDVAVTVYRNSAPYDTVLVDVERSTTNAVIVRFASAPAVDGFRVVVV